MEEQIYARLTNGVHKPKKHKIAVFLCGSSGTGKTTSKEKILNDAGLKGTYVDLNIDSISQLLTSREQALRIYGYLIRQTMQDGYSFLYDGTCRDRGSMAKRILVAKELGYRTIVGMTYTTLETALKRILARSEQPLDDEIAREIYGQVSKVAESLVKLKTVDEVYLYNNEHTSTLIFHKAKKSIECLHSDMDFYFDVSDFC
jgi:predicted kinase